MRGNLASEWKGLTLLALAQAITAAFLVVALDPPCDEAVLAAVAAEQGNVLPAVRPRPPMPVALR
jgi:hypothetical protein